MMKILIIDHYDSFTYNLVQLIGTLGAEPIVQRYDGLTLADVRRIGPDGIVLSPGPGNPELHHGKGLIAQILRSISRFTPTLGVCLGHQFIGHCFGARITQSPELIHGEACAISHDGQGIFHSVPQSVEIGRYHSLVIKRDSLPAELHISAQSADGSVMGIRHRHHPIEGVQFHPESILSQHGNTMMGNFLRQIENLNVTKGQVVL